MKNCIVVLPYTETARLFNASKTVKQEAFIGENGKEVYWQDEAAKFTATDACNLAIKTGNNQAFVRQID